MKTAKSAARKLCLFFLLIILAVLIGFFVYTGTYYHADPSAAEALESDDRVTVAKTEYGWMFDGPSEEDVLYDEIDSAWKVKQIREEKEELFRSLEMFYKVFADPDGAM